jgi:hypothetical protein
VCPTKAKRSTSRIEAYARASGESLPLSTDTAFPSSPTGLAPLVLVLWQDNDPAATGSRLRPANARILRVTNRAFNQQKERSL